MSLPVYIDIDGTLTTEPVRHFGPVRARRVLRVQGLIAAGVDVVLWSGGGTAYAREFAARHGLAATALGKPSLVVDDNPSIRPEGRMKIVDPREFFGD